MKTPLSTIPQLYRNMRRLTEILSVLSKYGLADWLSRLNVEFLDQRFKTSDGDVIARLSHPARLKQALLDLGPTFIKLGQMLSTRADVVGIAIADELATLQTQVPPDSFDSIRATIEAECEAPLEEVFASLSAEPIAVASIGQVHQARLPDGREVVVKVRRAGIERKVATDLDIIAGLAQLAEKLDEFRPYRPVQLVRQLSAAMLSELDFRNEQNHLTQFRHLFRHDRNVHIPQPDPRLCTSRMLTMERLDGIKLSALNGEGTIDRNRIARRGAQLYLRMIFEYGFFHADPHPGNILILPGDVIGLLDFGLVGRIAESLRNDVQAMLYAIVSDDLVMLTRLVRRVGSCPVKLDEPQLSSDLAAFVGRYSTQDLARFETSAALRDFLGIVRRHEISLPAEVSGLIKVLVTLDGTARELSPEFNLMQIMRPFLRKLMIGRLSPIRQARQLGRFLMQFERLAESLPSRLEAILEQIQSGTFDVHLDHRRLGPSVNRLVMGMLTSALFLGSSLMLSYQVPPLILPQPGVWGIHDLSLLGLTGCVVSFMFGFRLVWAIRKSGNLDRTE
jgi:ubiquinone biosynthesis protein